MAKTVSLYHKSNIVSPSWMITRRSPLGNADRGTTGTQFPLPPPSSPDADGPSATETWAALHLSRRDLGGAEWRQIGGRGVGEGERGRVVWVLKKERGKGLVVANAMEMVGMEPVTRGWEQREKGLRE